MRRAPCPPNRRRLGLLLALAGVVLLPVLLTLLAPPPLLADGPVFDAAVRDVSVAALDRVERLLAGALGVGLFAPARSGLEPVLAARWSASTGASSAPRIAPTARPSETERTL